MSEIIDFSVVKENRSAATSTLTSSDITEANGNKFLQIKEADNFGNKYYYAERLGVDSVAFILYDSRDDSYGLINEYKPPVNQYMTTAFGGSLDKDASKEQIVKEEVLEEAGYKVSLNNIEYLGKMFVSTQMNQYCHLYIVDITHSKYVGKQPQNETEAHSQVEWFFNKAEMINNLTDWKAITILSKLSLKGE